MTDYDLVIGDLHLGPYCKEEAESRAADLWAKPYCNHRNAVAEMEEASAYCSTR